jgi:two-component system, chemotaxis family, chemotaxis protein CheY
MREYRILIVDDNLMTRKLLTQHLTAMGFVRLAQAAGSETAANLLAQAYAEGESFDLILLDWHMPGEGGFQFLVECRADARFRLVPIIMVTAETDPNSILMAMNNGATSYIVKPISFADLKNSVFQALHRSTQKQLP